MQIFLHILLCIFIISMLGACSGEKKDKKGSKAKSDHLYRSQFDALEKAKNVEKKLQDAYKDKLEGIEEQR